MKELLDQLEEERDFLINVIGNTYEKDELLNTAGRIYEISKIIKTIKEKEGIENA